MILSTCTATFNVYRYYTLGPDHVRGRIPQRPARHAAVLDVGGGLYNESNEVLQYMTHSLEAPGFNTLNLPSEKLD
jgi:hypothetical protein